MCYDLFDFDQDGLITSHDILYGLALGLNLSSLHVDMKHLVDCHMRKQHSFASTNVAQEQSSKVLSPPAIQLPRTFSSHLAVGAITGINSEVGAACGSPNISRQVKGVGALHGHSSQTSMMDYSTTTLSSLSSAPLPGIGMIVSRDCISTICYRFSLSHAFY